MTPTPAPAPPDRLADVIADMTRAFHAPGPGLPGWLGQDLTLAQVRTLLLIAHEAPLPMGRIAEILGVTVASASGIVERLERHGLVVRRHRTDDRRVVECVPSDAGRRLIDDMSDHRAEKARRALAVLTPDELAEFHRLIRLVADRSAGEPG